MHSSEFLRLGEFESVSDTEGFIRNFAAGVQEKMFGKFSEEPSTRKKQRQERKKLFMKYRRRKDNHGRVFEEGRFQSLDVQTCPVDTLINLLGFHIVRLGRTIYIFLFPFLKLLLLDSKVISFKAGFWMSLVNKQFSHIVFGLSDSEWWTCNSLDLTKGEQIRKYFNSFDEIVGDIFRCMVHPSTGLTKDDVVALLLSCRTTVKSSTTGRTKTDHILTNEKKFNAYLVNRRYPSYMPRFAELFDLVDGEYVLNMDKPQIFGNFFFQLITLRLSPYLLAALLDPSLLNDESLNLHNTDDQPLVDSRDYRKVRNQFQKLPLSEFCHNLRQLAQFMSTKKEWKCLPIDLKVRKKPKSSDSGHLLMSAARLRYLISFRTRLTGAQLALTREQTWETMEGEFRGEPCFSSDQIQLQRLWLLGAAKNAFKEDEAIHQSFSFKNLNLTNVKPGSFEWLFNIYNSSITDDETKILEQSFQSLYNQIITLRFAEYILSFKPKPKREDRFTTKKAFWQEVERLEEQNRVKNPDADPTVHYVPADFWNTGKRCIWLKAIDFEAKKGSRKRKLEATQEYLAEKDKRLRLDNNYIDSLPSSEIPLGRSSPPSSPSVQSLDPPVPCASNMDAHLDIMNHKDGSESMSGNNSSRCAEQVILVKTEAEPDCGAAVDTDEEMEALLRACEPTRAELAEEEDARRKRALVVSQLASESTT